MNNTDRVYTDADLKKIKEILLEEYCEVLRICEKHSIPFFLDSGSCLGAVRHGGFIPWDDDMDLGFMREDYDRLLQILSEELGEKFGCDSWISNPDFPSPDACIYAKGTVAVPVEMKKCRYKYGISIGLFAYDSTYEDEKKRRRHLKKCWRCGRIHWLKMLPFPYLSVKGFMRYLILAVCGTVHIILKPISKKWIVKKCEKAFREASGTNTEKITIAFASKPERYVFDKSDIFPLRETVFEGKKAYIANDFDKYLTNVYGDYMKLPPVEDRKNHYPSELDFGPFED